MIIVTVSAWHFISRETYIPYNAPTSYHLGYGLRGGR
jgi:hypothetical protein